MGMDNGWRFSHEFTGGFDPHVATLIGRNATQSVLQFNECPEYRSSQLCCNVRRFFLAHREAVDAVTRAEVSSTDAIYWINDVPKGYEPALELTEWTPISAVVSFIVPIDSQRRGRITLAEQWACQFRVWESLPFEFHEEYCLLQGNTSATPDGTCPKRRIQRTDFFGDVEWKLYLDMVESIPNELIRRRGADYFRDDYWEFNLKAMCYMFASSVTGVNAVQFRLEFPDRAEVIVWDAAGQIINHEGMH